MALPTSDRVYFAAANKHELGRRLTDRLKPLRSEKWRDNREAMVTAYNHIYGRDVGYGQTSGIQRGGENGELALLRVNTAGSNLRAKHALVVAAQLAWKAQAKDGSSTAAASIDVANDILQDQWKNNYLGQVCDLWTEQCIGFSESFVFPEWKRGIGPPLAPRNGKMVTQGDLFYHLIPPWDVFRDNSAKSYRACQWFFVRVWQNRFDVAEEYTSIVGEDGLEPEAAKDRILSACQGAWDTSVSDGDRLRTESELVPVWHFFHAPSQVLPMGRYTVFISDTTVLRDEPIRGPNATYEGMPLERMAEREMVDSPHAWAPFWDTLGCQEIQDGIDTSLATIATTLGNPVIAYEQGSDFPEILATGFRAWKYPKGAKPPAQIKMGEFPPQSLEYRENLQTNQRQIMGLNDVALGQPQGAEMNAQAFAVLMSAAVQQASPLQAVRVTAIGKLGSTVLKLLAKHVRGSRSFVKEDGTTVAYDSEKLKAIDRVQVEIGNPLEQTASGKKVIMDDMMARNWITTPQQYFQVLNTGRLDSINKRATDEMTLVQWEVEQLKKGILPPVHHTMDHPLHFREGSGALLDKGAINDPACLQVVEQFLDAHYLLQFGVARNMDPMALMRERWMMQQQIGPGQEQPMQPPGAPPPGAGEPSEASTMAPPEVGAKESAPPVELPKNPATGEQLQTTPSPQ